MASFCERCGGPLVAFQDEGVARQKCARCGSVRYRNSKPCVSALVVRNGKVLLSRRARDPQRGLWDLPGGFLESGEHPEDGLRREMREETGLRASVRGLVSVEMGRWMELDTLNLLYEVEIEGEPQAQDDSLEMRFFDPDELPPMAFPHEERAVRAFLHSSPRASST